MRNLDNNKAFDYIDDKHLQSDFALTQTGMQNCTAVRSNLKTPVELQLCSIFNRLSGVQDRLLKLSIAFSAKPTVTGARTQYQIIPEKKYLDAPKAEDSKLRRFTIGKKDPQQPNKTVLLVGETGEGKSTLIDAMLNHLMGIEYEDNAWYKIIDEDVKQTSSKTETITVYEICGFQFPSVDLWWKCRKHDR